MEKVNCYSDTFKRKVVEEVLLGKINKAEANRKYGIRGSCTVLNWIRKFAGSPPQYSFMSSKKEKTVEQLKLEVEQLNHQLEYEKLKSEAFDTMIDIAEKEFKIPIRKKPGAKQSKK